MKKVTELKDGMKVWIPYKVKLTGGKTYPFVLENKNIGHSFTTTEDFKRFIDDLPFEIYEQEEVPNLTPVKMEASDDGVEWYRANVIGKLENHYLTTSYDRWNFARPIQKTVTLEMPESELTDELRKYLKG